MTSGFEFLHRECQVFCCTFAGANRCQMYTFWYELKPVTVPSHTTRLPVLAEHFKEKKTSKIADYLGKKVEKLVTKMMRVGVKIAVDAAFLAKN